MKQIVLVLVALVLPFVLSARSIFKVEGNSVIVDLEGSGVKSKILKIEIWSNSTIKVTSGMSKTFSDKPSLITHSQPVPVKFKALYSGNKVEITTPSMIVYVEENGLVQIMNRKGMRLMIESDRHFSPSETEEGAYSVNQRFYLYNHEHIYGLGQAGEKPRYSLRNTNFEVRQSLDEIASPVLFSEKGYAMIWDNYSKTQFEDTRAGMSIASDVADEIQYFFIYGPEWDHIISEIRQLSGSVPMLPKWMYGFWHSPMAYNSSEQQTAAVERYVQNQVLVDVNTTGDFKFYTEELKSLQQPQAPRYASMGFAKNIDDQFTAYKAENPDRRLSIPTHTAFPGIQRHGTYLRAGKIESNWETLKNQVSAGVNLSLTGQPYWSTNIGGIAENGTAIDPELLTRWFQFAAFTPVFQANEADREVWAWSKPGDGFFEAATLAIRMRYSMMPYIYSMAHKVSAENFTLMRSLLFDFMADEKVHDINNQYLFGTSIMVCPITTSNKQSKTVYLPAGSDWFDFWTGEKLTGGKETTFGTNIESIPLFVKAGSIVPFACKSFCTNEQPEADMEIRVYPGADAQFVLYDDQGDGFGYQTGQSSRITLSYTEKSRSFEVGSVEGSFENMTIERKLKVVLVDVQNGNGAKPTATGTIIDYKGKKMKVKL